MMTTPSRYALSPYSRMPSIQKRAGIVEGMSCGQSPIQRDYLDSSVPRFRNVSPTRGVTSERRFQINTSEPFGLNTSANPLSSLEVPSRGKRERSQSGAALKDREAEPTSGGRWVLSALRRLPLVGSLVGSQDIEEDEKEEEEHKEQGQQKCEETGKKKKRPFSTAERFQDTSRFAKALPEEDAVYTISSAPHISCDVTASPSFKSLATRSSFSNKDAQPTFHSNGGIGIPTPSDNELRLSQNGTRATGSEYSITYGIGRSDPGLCATATDIGEENDLQRLLEMRRQYGLKPLYFQESLESTEEGFQGKKQKLSPLVQTSLPSSFKSASWDLFSSGAPLPIARSEQTPLPWQASVSIGGQSNGSSFKDTNPLTSIKAFRKKRGLRAVDYRRLLQQAKFRPCHWIDYFDYVKAKTADEEDQRRYTKQSEKTLILPEVTKIGKPLNSHETATKGFLEDISSHDAVENLSLSSLYKRETAPLSQLESKNHSSLSSLDNQGKGSQAALVTEPLSSGGKLGKNDLGLSVNTSAKDFNIGMCRIEDGGMGTEKECIEKPFHETSHTVKNTTSKLFRVDEENGKESTTSLKPSKTDCATETIPWWQANLNKNVEIPLEESGVFADNADDEAREGKVVPGKESLSGGEQGQITESNEGILASRPDVNSLSGKSILGEHTTEIKGVNFLFSQSDSSLNVDKTISGLSSAPVSKEFKSLTNNVSNTNELSSILFKDQPQEGINKVFLSEGEKSEISQIHSRGTSNSLWNSEQKDSNSLLVTPQVSSVALNSTMGTFANTTQSELPNVTLPKESETSQAIAVSSGQDPSPFGSNLSGLFKSTGSTTSNPLTFGQMTTPLSANIFSPTTASSGTSLFGNLISAPQDKGFLTTQTNTADTRPLINFNATSPSTSTGSFALEGRLFEGSALGAGTPSFNPPAPPSFTPLNLDSDERRSKRNAAASTLFSNVSSEVTKSPEQCFEGVPQNMFSFGSSAISQSSPSLPLISSTSNPFAANAASFASSSGPRRPKIRLKRTLR